MKFVQIVKGKLFVAVLAGVVLVGGATVAFASTPAGRDIVHAVTQSQSTASQADKASHKNNGHTTTTTSHSNSCPGLPEAQQLAGKFSSIAGRQKLVCAGILCLCTLPYCCAGKTLP